MNRRAVVSAVIFLTVCLVSLLVIGLARWSFFSHADTTNAEWALTSTTQQNPSTSRNVYLGVNKLIEGATWYCLTDKAKPDVFAYCTDLPQSTYQIPHTVGAIRKTGQLEYTLSAYNDKPDSPANLGFNISQLYSFPGSQIYYYDYSFENFTFSVKAEEKEPGKISLTVVPKPGTTQDILDKVQYYYWGGYENIAGRWVFKGNVATTTKPQTDIVFSKPGTIGIRVFAYSKSEAGPGKGVRASGSPVSPPLIELTVPPEGMNPDVPSGSSENQFTSSTAIPGDMQFALTKDAITLFSDGALYLPLALYPLPKINPSDIEVELPNGIDLKPSSVPTYDITDVTSQGAGDSISAGYHRYILTRKSTIQTWSSVPLFPHFSTEDIIGKKDIYMRVRAYNSGGEDRNNNWQKISINCESIPDIQLPKRLVTSYTWAKPDNLSPDTDDFFGLYKKLGFNTVPTVGLQWIKSGDLFAQTARDTEDWSGLKYGPEISPYYQYYDDSIGTSRWGIYRIINIVDIQQDIHDAGGIDSYVDGKDINSLYKLNLSAAEISVEKDKWKKALHYSEKHTIGVDMGYDGVFLTKELESISAKIAQTKPEYLFIDAEGFSTYSKWRDSINDSALSQSQKKAGETNSQLAYRMSEQFLEKLVAAVKQASANTKIGLYGTDATYGSGYQVFPAAMLKKLGIIFQPSAYTQERNVDGLSQWWRLNRQFGAQGTGLVPWLTSGTYGEMDPSLVFDEVIHTFLNGANGFSVYTYTDIDDMADMLNMTKAIGLISPYEDIVMDGDLAYQDISDINNASVSAMKDNGKYLLAVTPKDTSQPVSFNINTGVASNYTLKDLRHSQSKDYRGKTIAYSGSLNESTVMLLEVGASPSPRPVGQGYTFNSSPGNWDLRVVNFVKSGDTAVAETVNSNDVVYSYDSTNNQYQELSQGTLADQSLGNGYWYKNKSDGDVVTISGAKAQTPQKVTINSILSVIGNYTQQDKKLSDIVIGINDKQMTLAQATDDNTVLGVFQYDWKSNGYNSFYAKKYTDYANKNNGKVLTPTLADGITLKPGQAVWVIFASKFKGDISGGKVVYTVK